LDVRPGLERGDDKDLQGRKIVAYFSQEVQRVKRPRHEQVQHHYLAGEFTECRDEFCAVVEGEDYRNVRRMGQGGDNMHPNQGMIVYNDYAEHGHFLVGQKK
jgi:hypothetical protein